MGTGAARPWPTRRRFTVTYHDVDALNHLNHAVYLQYMETLRCEYYLGRSGRSDPRSLDIIIAEATCRYLAPAYYGSEMLGEVAPDRSLGRSSFALLYRFSDPDRSDRLYARGRTVVVTYDYASNLTKPIPPGIRSMLETDGIDSASEGWAPLGSTPPPPSDRS